MLKSNLSSFLLISSLLLSGCGGGGGGSTSTETGNSNNTTQNSSSLKVNAGADRKAQINEEITISGYITGDGVISSYEWTKDSQVLATTLKFVYIPTQLGIENLKLSAIDNQGNELSDTMEIEVLQEYHESPLPF